MGRPRRFDGDEVVSLYSAGLSARNVSRRLGISDTTVLEHLRASGCVMRPTGRRGRDEQTIAAICEAYVSGEKLDVISLVHSVSKGRICHIVRAAGFPLRRGKTGSLEELGRAAAQAGMTIADIEAWARSRGGDSHA